MRTYLVAAILAGLVLTLACFAGQSGFAAEPAANKDALDKHAKELAAAIPGSWEVRVDGDSIWIEYKQTVEMYSTAPNGPPGPQPKIFERPALLLYSVPAITQADMDALDKKNTDRAKALEMLASQMKDLISNSMPLGDQGGYRAANPDQQARLDAYVAVCRALPYQTPPSLFAADSAFRWGYLWTSPADPAIQAQMEQIRAKIESLFATKPLK